MKRWQYCVLLLICVSIGVGMILPFYDDKSLLERFISADIHETPGVEDDPQYNTTPAYNYFSAPPNSFGTSSWRDVNWSYFKQLFLDHTDWMLEYKRYSYSEWTNGDQYMSIERSWVDDGFWKFNLIFDAPVDVYEARFTFGCDLPVLNYVERSGTEVWINYTANATETYSMMFNYSDLLSIPGLYFDKGIYQDMWYFRFGRFNIPAGHYEFDPIFGRNTQSASTNIGDYVIAIYDAPASDGTVDNITAYVDSQDVDLQVQCALYAYTDWGTDYAGALINVTEIRDHASLGNGAAGWYVFDFDDGWEPSVSSGTNYYIAVQNWKDANWPIVIADCKYGYDGVGGQDIRETSWNSTWENPWTGENTGTVKWSWYASYTEGGAEPTAGVDLFGLSTNSVYNDTISWNSTTSDPDDEKYCNSSGFRNETIRVNLTTNATTNISEIHVWAGPLNNTGNRIMGDNLTLWISGDNVTWTVCGDNWWGYGDGVFPPTGGNLSINASTWDEASDNPFNYFGNGTFIQNSTDIYLRIELNMSSRDDFISGNYTNDTMYYWWMVYVANDTWVFYDQARFNGTFNYTARIWEQIPGGVWNVSFSNTTREEQTFTWNISFSNTSVDEQIFTWNVSFSNTSTNTSVGPMLWNISFSNTSTNTSIGPMLWNVSFSNSSGRGWMQTSSWNISFSNSSNLDQTSTWNVSFSNSSRGWDQIVSWNISFSNGSSMRQTFSWNISFSNSSIVIIEISDVYPSNNTFLQGVQPTMYFTLNHLNGASMNYSLFYGNSSANTSTLFEMVTGISNGTFHYVNYFTATNYSIPYWWRIWVNASSESVNESYMFTPVRAGGQVFSRDNLWAVGAAFAIIFPIALFILFKKRRNKL